MMLYAARASQSVDLMYGAELLYKHVKNYLAVFQNMLSYAVKMNTILQYISLILLFPRDIQYSYLFKASLSRCQGVNRAKDDTAKQEPARVCFRAQMPLPPSLTKVLQVRRLPNPSLRHFSSVRSGCRSHHYAVMLSAKRFS